MPREVCMGATMQCSFGMAPNSLVVLPVDRTYIDQVPDANIMDHVPLVNIMPFGLCSLHRQPGSGRGDIGCTGRPDPDALCTEYPRSVGSRRAERGPGQCPTLDNVAKLMCVWGGVIQFVTPGEFTVEVP